MAVGRRMCDIFISVRNTGEDGAPTLDSVIADRVYKKLSEAGFEVFLSEEIADPRYAENMERALHEAPLLVLVGTERENLVSPLVRRQWTDFVGQVRGGIKPGGEIIAVLEGMVPTELPSHLGEIACFSGANGNRVEDVLGYAAEKFGREIRLSGKTPFVPKELRGSVPTSRAAEEYDGYAEKSSSGGGLVRMLAVILVLALAAFAVTAFFSRDALKNCAQAVFHKPQTGQTEQAEPEKPDEAPAVSPADAAPTQPNAPTEPTAPPVDPGLQYTVEGGAARVTGYTGSAETLVVPETLGGAPVTTIGEHAFSGNKTLRSVTFPATLTEIETFAFYQCTALESAELPEGVTQTGEHAFNGCAALKMAAIPATLTDLGYGTFISCDSLLVYEVARGNPKYKSAGGVLFSADGGTLVSCPGGFEGAYTVPEGTTEIATGAFHACGKLTAVTLPEGLKKIGKHAFSNTALTEADVPASVTELGNYAFYGCKNMTKCRLRNKKLSVPNHAFGGCAKGFRLEKGQ